MRSHCIVSLLYRSTLVTSCLPFALWISHSLLVLVVQSICNELVQPAGPSLSHFFPRDELLVYSRKMHVFNELVPKCMALHFVLLKFIQILLQQSSRSSSSSCTLCQSFSVLMVPPYFFPLSHSYFCARVINENIKEEASCWELH